VGVVIVAPVVLLLLAPPISIAGWGLREGLFVVGFGLKGSAGCRALCLDFARAVKSHRHADRRVLWILQSAPHYLATIEERAECSKASAARNQPFHSLKRNVP
jgi:hypothetical protein